MGLADDHKYLLGLTIVLSVIIHGLALSYVTIETWKNSDQPTTPILRIKLSKMTTEHQRQPAKPVNTQKTEQTTKQVIPPKKHPPEKKPLPRKPVSPKFEEKPTPKQPTTTPSTVETYPKEALMADVKPNNIESQPIENITEMQTSPITATPPQMPAYLNNPKPFYPIVARRRGIQGSVILEVTVSASGAATQVLIKKSSGYKLLDRAASDTVASWRFIPASENGENIEAIVEIPIRFELTQG
jgi:protein TonB